MLKLLIAVAAGLALYRLTGLHPDPVEVKGLAIGAGALLAIWIGLAGVNSA